MKCYSDFDFQGGEIINIDKPIGITSFSVVYRIRKWTRCRKVGHAGTLDPLASGVLLICTGQATKRVSDLMSLEKMYEGTIEIGKITETDDSEGKILEHKQVPDFKMEEIQAVLKEFEGEIEQIPPMYSALKKNGNRLYTLARKGEFIPREPRKIRIHEIKLLEWERPFLRFCMRCSKGTYVRALARDIGNKLDTGGYLKTLRRTRIGPYRVEDAYPLNTFKELIIGNGCL